MVNAGFKGGVKTVPRSWHTHQAPIMPGRSTGAKIDQPTGKCETSVRHEAVPRAPTSKAIRPWSQPAQIFRHIAKLLQYDRVRKLANVRIACTLECDRPRIVRSGVNSFDPPDRGGFALALLCFARRGTVLGPNEWESNVIGYGHGGLLSILNIVSA